MTTAADLAAQLRAAPHLMTRDDLELAADLLELAYPPAAPGPPSLPPPPPDGVDGVNSSGPGRDLEARL